MSYTPNHLVTASISKPSVTYTNPNFHPKTEFIPDETPPDTSQTRPNPTKIKKSKKSKESCHVLLDDDESETKILDEPVWDVKKSSETRLGVVKAKTIEENREVTKLFDKENIERGLPPRSQEKKTDSSRRERRTRSRSRDRERRSRSRDRNSRSHRRRDRSRSRDRQRRRRSRTRSNEGKQPQLGAPNIPPNFYPNNAVNIHEPVVPPSPQSISQQMDALINLEIKSGRTKSEMTGPVDSLASLSQDESVSQVSQDSSLPEIQNGITPAIPHSGYIDPRTGYPYVPQYMHMMHQASGYYAGAATPAAPNSSVPRNIPTGTPYQPPSKPKSRSPSQSSSRSRSRSSRQRRSVSPKRRRRRSPTRGISPGRRRGRRSSSRSSSSASSSRSSRSSRDRRRNRRIGRRRRRSFRSRSRSRSRSMEKKKVPRIDKNKLPYHLQKSGLSPTRRNDFLSLSSDQPLPMPGKTIQPVDLSLAAADSEMSIDDIRKVLWEDYDSKMVYGKQFLVPVSGYFCRLCQKFYQSSHAALEKHTRSEIHFKNLKKLLSLSTKENFSDKKRKKDAQKMSEIQKRWEIIQKEDQENRNRYLASRKNNALTSQGIMNSASNEFSASIKIENAI